MTADRGEILHRRVQETVDRLSAEFEGVYSRESIARCASESLDRLRDAELVEYLPVFVHRFTRERLMAQAHVDELMEKTMPEILFVCVHNAGRSQIAAVFAHALGDGEVHVRSAGSQPAAGILASVATAMQEIGLDLSQEFPKPLTDEVVRAADVVVTMGCGDACPVYPGKKYVDWDLEDPTGKDLDTVRRIRDDIRERVEGLLRELDIDVVPLP